MSTPARPRTTTETPIGPRPGRPRATSAACTSFAVVRSQGHQPDGAAAAPDPGRRPGLQQGLRPRRVEVGTGDDEVVGVDRHVEDARRLVGEARLLGPPAEHALPQLGPQLLVGADGGTLREVVGRRDLGRGLVDHLPQPGADLAQVPGLEGDRTLLDQVLPDQPAAEPERAQDVVERQSLLGAPPAGRARRVVRRVRSARPARGPPAVGHRLRSSSSTRRMLSWQEARRSSWGTTPAER